MKGNKGKEELDWAAAEEKLMDTEQKYLEMMGLPGVNVTFFFTVVLPPIRGAFNNGIRDRRLYKQIMDLR